MFATAAQRLGRTAHACLAANIGAGIKDDPRGIGRDPAPGFNHPPIDHRRDRQAGAQRQAEHAPDSFAGPKTRFGQGKRGDIVADLHREAEPVRRRPGGRFKPASAGALTESSTPVRSSLTMLHSEMPMPFTDLLGEELRDDRAGGGQKRRRIAGLQFGWDDAVLEDLPG